MSTQTLLPGAAAPVGETPGWLSAHYDEPFHRQRTAKLPAKLRALGVLDLRRDARVLDTCCGKGEALMALRREGFRHLAGADGCRHPEWSRTPGIRFAACDVRELPFGDGEFDAVMNLHALHHLGDAAGVHAFLQECRRVLKPGGKLFILDFPGSPQIRLAFELLRRRLAAVTPGLRNFAEILDEEWPYLMPYVQDWRAVEAVLRDGPLRVARWKQGLFLYYATWVKEDTAPSRPATTVLGPDTPLDTWGIAQRKLMRCRWVRTFSR